MSVFAHKTNIINKHQFPVHTENTTILHSLHTTVTIMYSSNGCTSNVLVLQKIFWMQFGTAITIIWITSINYNFFKGQSSIKQVSATHITTSRRFSNMPYNNNDLSYNTTHHTTQYIPWYGSHLNTFNIHAICTKTFVSTYLLPSINSISITV